LRVVAISTVAHEPKSTKHANAGHAAEIDTAAMSAREFPGVFVERSLGDGCEQQAALWHRSHGVSPTSADGRLRRHRVQGRARLAIAAKLGVRSTEYACLLPRRRTKPSAMTTYPMLRLLAAAFVLGTSSSCATMRDVVRDGEMGEGTTRTYVVSPDRAWDIARSVLVWEGGAERIEDRRGDGYMLASSGVEAFSWGTHMGVWIAPVDRSRVRVTVVTKRKVSTNFATALTESTFHERFAEEAARPSRPTDSLR
jgi:hypothetical protein